MKTKNESIFSRHFLTTVKLCLIAFLMASFGTKASAQVIPTNCLESPSADFIDAITFLKSPLGGIKSLSVTVWEFESSIMTLDAGGVGNNMGKLTRTGNTIYKKADVEGNSCLKRRNIVMKSIANCKETKVAINWSLGVGGAQNLPPNPGFVLFGIDGYSKVSAFGTGTNRTYLFKKDTNPTKYLMVNFQAFAVL